MNSIDQKEPSAQLQILLDKIDAALPSEVRATLREPASGASLDALAGAFKSRLPPEVQVLLEWHDGQEWNAPLSKKNNRRLMSAAEIAEQIMFFADPLSDVLGPWEPSWLPILTNDAGDFVVYQTQGSQSGSLCLYWHDDERRGTAHPSLQSWALELLNEYRHADA